MVVIAHFHFRTVAQGIAPACVSRVARLLFRQTVECGLHVVAHVLLRKLLQRHARKPGSIETLLRKRLPCLRRLCPCWLYIAPCERSAVQQEKCRQNGELPAERNAQFLVLRRIKTQKTAPHVGGKLGDFYLSFRFGDVLKNLSVDLALRRLAEELLLDRLSDLCLRFLHRYRLQVERTVDYYH